ncbi:telomeric repeat-binding factor 2-like [Pomacea canaliculata]|uniref:telomeric repeat-binding factor 2-like n=1 Tax=Pomacea canaliculata TaxID=400727 RepID=UPI000D735B27|nr:telomeric repeat-binding factor 2-like [Pomacea canaliculata]
MEDFESDDMILVSDWIIEYFCPYILRRFIDNSYLLDEVSRYLIDGVLGVIRDQRDVENKKEAVFLAVFAHLSNVQSPDTSVLEDDAFDDFFTSITMVLKCIDRLKLNITEHHDLNKEADILKQKTVLQAAFILCRKSQYDQAEMITEKLSPMCENMVNVKAKISRVLKAKQKPHKCLEEESFETYSESFGNFMTAVCKTFKTPILTSVASAFTMEPSWCSKRKAVSSKNMKRIKEGENMMSIQTENENHLAHKLERIRSEMSCKLVSPSNKFTVARRVEQRSDKEPGESECGTKKTLKKKIQDKSSCSRLEKSEKSEDHENCLNRCSLECDCEDSSGNKSSKSEQETEKYYKNRNKPDRHSEQAELGSSSDNSCCVAESVESGGRSHRKKRHASGDSIAEGSSDDAFESLTKRIKKQKILSLRRLRLSLGPKPNSKKRLKWTESEEREFFKAVRQHGAGNWALIRSHLCTHRSTIQLKDKWRNICKKNGTP